VVEADDWAIQLNGAQGGELAGVYEKRWGVVGRHKGSMTTTSTSCGIPQEWHIGSSSKRRRAACGMRKICEMRILRTQHGWKCCKKLREACNTQKAPAAVTRV